MDLTGLNVVVIGAGIGGMAAALVLRRQGASVRVLEQAPEITEVGAGIQVSPNGFVVLKALELGDRLRATSPQGTHIRLRDYSGKLVMTLDLGLSGHSDYYFVHRADLLNLLLGAAVQSGVEVSTGAHVTDVAPGTTPTVTNRDGHTHSADLVIGADGLHSVARAALNGTVAPFFTQQVAWRAVVPETEAAHMVDLYMGPRRHIVTYPLRQGRLRNIVAVEERTQWVAESWSQQDDPDAMRAVFADFGPDVQALLRRVDQVNLWGLFRHPVAPSWQAGNVALLGDAAHPTLPFLAQGANMALEDAWTLGKCLSKGSDISSALARYQDLRKDRTARIVLAASKNAWKYHLSFRPLRGMAHAGLKLGGLVAPGRMIGQFDWIYGHDVTQ
ncbi:FAD-dependent monooxygenase [Roseovarius rhodophyticola]|uniref:FAD-dependent monooxygenase n=1 Tax=Roseovarius rhodophyticola TaxID=3080827 RepID=A0ABZ2TET6_9RHOB|nr:FAD-dependent monooxygenase [Roseovarius sp. W115]MDV2928026.1 FAD-dependent monooxygenase [Roseovarius sp. W115]